MIALKATILVGLAAIAAGHLCMMSPPQRGSFQGFNKAGNPDCALVKAPCGGRPASSNPILLKAGQSFRTVIQKNLDHFYSGNPGHFSVSFGTTSNMKLIGTIPDNSDPSLSLYALNVTIPYMPILEVEVTKSNKDISLGKKVTVTSVLYNTASINTLRSIHINDNNSMRFYFSPGNYLFQTQYNHQNPNVGAVFYQCADITIV